MTLTLGRTLILGIYLIIAGLAMCGVGLPRWVLLLGGILGIIAGVLFLVTGGA
jgi:hypothetical protein